MTAVSLLFSFISQAQPVLRAGRIGRPLDESNINRFIRVLHVRGKLAVHHITHNKRPWHG